MEKNDKNDEIEILDSFSKIEKIGHGKTADVYKCSDSKNNSVAVKLFKDIRTDKNVLKNEVSVISELNHKNIMKYVTHDKNSIQLEFC